MDIYSLVSDSHEYLKDYFFVPSINRYERGNFSLHMAHHDQICKEAKYMSDGWKEMMMFKIDQYITASNNSDMFIWSDVDIEFYDAFIENCKEQLGNHEIAFQKGNNNEYCAGFFIARSTDNVKNFFLHIKNNYQQYQCDQSAINANITKVRAKFLNDDFYNVGFQHRRWSGQDFSIGKPIKMFHANYTEGLENKIVLLSLVKTKIELLNNRYQINHKNDIVINKALYGMLEDVTFDIKTKNQNPISLSLPNRITNMDQYFYFFDDSFKLITKPISEQLFIKQKT